jgi:hypothetical protein
MHGKFFLMAMNVHIVHLFLLRVMSTVHFRLIMSRARPCSAPSHRLDIQFLVATLMIHNLLIESYRRMLRVQ